MVGAAADHRLGCVDSEQDVGLREPGGCLGKAHSEIGNAIPRGVSLEATAGVAEFTRRAREGFPSDVVQSLLPCDGAVAIQ